MTWNVLGHEWAERLLAGHIRRGETRHAYLITGPPGVGRRTLALRFAKALNCPQPPAPGAFCGTCRTCKQIERMQYPDLAIIQAEKEGGVLKVEQIRQVRQSLSLKPYQGRYRVALFLRFQEANANASNALLKTLEEAPAHVVLLLTADNAEQLLPTIVSRCETLRLRPLPVEAVEGHLRAGGADPSAARLLAHVSGGRPGYARHLMEDKDNLEFRAKRLDDLERLLGANRRERFAFAEKLADRKGEARERLRDTLLLWLSYWRDVMLRAAGSSAALTNVDHEEKIGQLAASLGLEPAHRLVHDAEAAIERLEKNVNARLLAEVLLLDWPRLG